MASNPVSASAKGATFLILLQIGSRAVTFLLNQYLLRFLSPQLLAISVQLELYKMGTMYFARESLRVAAERRSDGGVQTAINLSYLAIIAGLPIGAVLAEWYLSMQVLDVAYFAQALRIYQLAAFGELLMEPAFTAVQQNLMYGARAAAEGSSVILKTLTVFGLFIWANANGKDLGVLPYAAGEMVNSIVLTSVYWTMTAPVAREKKFSLWPTKMVSSSSHAYAFSYFSKPLLWLITSLFFQTGIKWLLTEGDKLLITVLASLEDQGLYALAANYGGLIARMIFQPIEVSARNLFANLCATSGEDIASSDPSTNKKAKKKDEKQAKTTKADITSASEVLVTILRTYNIVSLLIFTIGPTAAPLLLRLVAGSTAWAHSGAGEVLGMYCYYIPFLAVNGVSEAFVAATASTKDLRDQGFWMTGFSALFAASAWLLVSDRSPVGDFGAKGLVLANCVNMGLRVGFNLWYITGYFKGRGVVFNAADILPNMYAIGAATVAPGLLRQSEAMEILKRYGLLGELARVGGFGMVFGLIILATERKFLLVSFQKFSGKG